MGGARAVCLDWKTGKHRNDQMQLEISALQIFCHYPVKIVSAGYVWLRDGILDCFEFKRDDLEVTLEDFIAKDDKIDEYERLNTWPTIPSKYKCTYCPVSKRDCHHKQ